MYGHVNLALHGYIVERHGEDAWNNIAKTAKCSTTFQATAVYDDAVTQRIIDAAVKQLGIKREPFLELVGEFYFTYIQKTGHDEFLRNLGENILDFIQNLDSVHSVMTSQFPEMNSPSFLADSSSSKDRLVLHYYSFRKGYAHLVIGILKAVAKTYYNMELTITILSINNEKLSEKHGSREHVVYNILAMSMSGDTTKDGPPTLVAQTKKHGEKQILKADVEKVKKRLEQIRREYGDEALPVAQYRARVNQAKWKAVAKMSILRKGFVINYPESLAVNPRRFCEVFPYHIIFTPLMKVHQTGEQIQKMMTSIQTPSSDVHQYFSLVNPHSLDFTFDNVKRFVNTPFVLKMKREQLNKDWKHSEEQLVLKGQMIELPAENMMLYLGSPFVRSFKHLEERKIYYADIAGHDVTRDLLFTDLMFRYQTSGNKTRSKRRSSQVSINAPVVISSNRFGNNEDLRDELERTRAELAQEKDINAELMSHYLPSSVASKYITGDKFDAGEYRQVTVLFCDIVNFLQYPTECKVSSVVSLLNQLTEKFDGITRVHDTFRVASIGDAYLVVGGIPDKVATHTERVANTGLAMLYCCEDVKSPISWSHNVEIRLGMHTGPLKCGVVGHRVPRFIVMGDTATVASRMESHGEPGRIHVTPQVKNALHNKGFSLRERGEITLRGLGDLTTYFLVSNDNATPAELLGLKSNKNDISFINEGKERNPNFNDNKGHYKTNKVKPAQSTPSSGVGSNSSRPVTGEEDYIPYSYHDNKTQQKNNKLRK